MPLRGIRVVELGSYHAAPGGSAILGDLGADIIKVESFQGDSFRKYTESGASKFALPSGEGLPFQFTNRNKRSICLNMAKSTGLAVFRKLIEGADVFITNLRNDAKTRLKIDYQNIYAINPRIIYAGLSGFGNKGPECDTGGFDPLAQARSGIMFLNGDQQPSLIELAVLDQAASIVLSHAVLSALLVRERSGIGQELHTSLYGSTLWLMYINVLLAGCLSCDPTHSDRKSSSPLRNWYRCKDGKWLMGTHHPEPKYWPLFCRATGQEFLLDDPRFADITQIDKDRAELVEHFDRVFATKGSEEWLAIFRDHGLMFCLVNHIEDTIADPQALANSYVEKVKDPLLGDVIVPGYPVQFSDFRVGIRSVAPKLGEHTYQILREIGYSEQEILNLENEDVVKQLRE
jgi:crotonobetainyl-CoA:carnitine CoA-transferase CaiB-like acyl-CoA transferase